MAASLIVLQLFVGRSGADTMNLANRVVHHHSHIAPSSGHHEPWCTHLWPLGHSYSQPRNTSSSSSSPRPFLALFSTMLGHLASSAAGLCLVRGT